MQWKEHPVRFLFYKEEAKLGNTFGWLDKWCNFYGLTPIVIDLEGPYPKKEPTTYYLYRNLQEALDDPAHRGFKWIWLTPEGDTFLDEIKHPKKKVIYCVGSDIHGFEGLDLPGKKVKLRYPTEASSEEWPAAMVLPLVLYDRYLRLK